MKHVIKIIFLFSIALLGYGCNDKQILLPAVGPKLNVGDHYHGGVVIYVDGSRRHGVVALEENLYISYPWSSGYTNTGATLTGVYEGATNTNIIISYYGSSNAAGACDSETASTESGTYSDWYLPSIDELDLIYQARNFFEYSPYNYHWSSSETSSSSAWIEDLSSGNITLASKTSIFYYKPVRKF